MLVYPKRLRVPAVVSQLAAVARKERGESMSHGHVSCACEGDPLRVLVVAAMSRVLPFKGCVRAHPSVSLILVFADGKAEIQHGILVATARDAAAIRTLTATVVVVVRALAIAVTVATLLLLQLVVALRARLRVAPSVASAPILVVILILGTSLIVALVLLVAPVLVVTALAGIGVSALRDGGHLQRLTLTSSIPLTNGRLV